MIYLIVLDLVLNDHVGNADDTKLHYDDSFVVCLHVRRSVVESTQKCLLTILSHSYKLVNESLDTWVPGVKDIQKIIASYGKTWVNII